MNLHLSAGGTSLPGRVEGKVAFVTGGASGIGRATAGLLALSPAPLAVCWSRHRRAPPSSLREDDDLMRPYRLSTPPYLSAWFCQLVEADIVTRQTGTLSRSSPPFRRPALYL